MKFGYRSRLHNFIYLCCQTSFEPQNLKMWRIPTDTPQVAIPNGLKLAEVTVDTPLDEVFKHWKESGGVILKNILTTSEANQITKELESRLDSVHEAH